MNPILMLCIALNDPQITGTITPGQVEVRDWKTLLYFLVPLILSNVGMWIREVAKMRGHKHKNGQLATIIDNTNTAKGIALSAKREITDVKTTVTSIDTKIGEMKENCTKTVAHIQSGITDNTQKIFELAKNGRGKV